jgi:hypothetical protein
MNAALILFALTFTMTVQGYGPEEPQCRRNSDCAKLSDKDISASAVCKNGRCVIAHPSWFACKSDWDCIVAEGNCGENFAVNKNFVRFMKQDEPDKPCTNIPKYPDNLIAVCKNHQCIFATVE